MDNTKYYAVRRGRNPGIYYSWKDCKAQVDGYSGAAFKSFDSEEKAQAYLIEASTGTPANEKLPYAYIDGSYSKRNNCYGWGGFICDKGRYTILQGTGSAPAYLQERNIAGELIGALQVVFQCMKLGIHEINLYHDYSGTENYITGSWEARTPLAKYYRDTIDLLHIDVVIHFLKVEGHTGIEGNDIADYLAKDAVGAQLTKRAAAAVQAFKDKATGTNSS